MEAIELIVKVLLALIVVGFVGYPILKEDQDDEVVEMPEEQQELYRRKESTYSALKELEFDYRTGKLSEADYRDLDGKYRSEAVELLEAIELLEKGEQPRQARRPAAARRPATASAQAKSPALFTCDSCGTENQPSAKFCASCGESMTQSGAPIKRGAKTAAACGQCGTPLKSGYRFCGGCGAEVTA